MDIYYKPGIIISDKAKIMIPYADEPITIKKFKKKYTEFAKTFDGSLSESFLSVFWTFNKTTGIFEFIDADLEDEVAENLTIKIEDSIDKLLKKMDESTSSKASGLSKEELAEFKLHLEDIHEMHKKFSESTITHKKE